MPEVIEIKIDGKDVSEIELDLVELTVDDSLTLPNMFSIHLQDAMDLRTGKLKYTDDACPIGKSVEITIETDEILDEPGVVKETIFKGEITGVEPRFTASGTPSLILRGYDKSHRLLRGKKTRTFLNSKDSDIVRKIVTAASLDCGTIDNTQEVHEYVIQDNKTDWEFLLSRAKRVGCWVYMRDGKLYFTKNTGGQSATLTWGLGLAEFNARLSTALQVSEVVAQGWDPETQKAIISKRITKAEGLPEIGQTPIQGGALAKKVFGPAEEIVVDRPVSTVREAEQIAGSVCDEIGQGFISAECRCRLGHPKIKSGDMVTIEGIGERFSGNYRVTHVLHRFTTGHYTTEFTVGGRHITISDLLEAKNGSNDARSWPVLGKVTNLDDPDGLGRVQVKFPWLIASNGVEAGTFWVRHVAPGAGDGRGLYFLPEINDEVLIAFEHGDVHRPYIIGTLWNNKDKPPKPNSECVADGKVNERIIKSRSGHVIILDDTDGKEQMIIRDKTGKNEIVINSKENTMTVKAGNGITIETGGKITIKSSGDDLTLEGKNLTIKANQNLDLQAMSMCSIKANQTCTVEGTVGVTVKNAAAEIAMSGPTVNINKGALEVM